jgi:hypothetical protein
LTAFPVPFGRVGEHTGPQHGARGENDHHPEASSPRHHRPLPTILVVLAAVATVAVGAIFNLVCRRTGGVEVTVGEAPETVGGGV